MKRLEQPIDEKKRDKDIENFLDDSSCLLWTLSDPFQKFKNSQWKTAKEESKSKEINYCYKVLIL